MIPINKDIFFMFLFYVIGDTTTTYYGIKCGGYESNSFPAMILNMDYGIYLLFIVKSLFILWVWYNGFKLIKGKYHFAWNIIKNTVVGIGIIATISNTYLIFTGQNIFQHAGLM